MSSLRLWSVELFYTHIEPWLLAVFSALVAACGFLIKKVWDMDKKLAAHEASDQAIFISVRDSLERLEAGHVRIEGKVDNLIERSHQDTVSALRAELGTRHV